jgi:hypothetical protein
MLGDILPARNSEVCALLSISYVVAADEGSPQQRSWICCWTDPFLDEERQAPADVHRANGGQEGQKPDFFCHTVCYIRA